MNGRVYDYQLGRFLSVDPFVQFPLNSQSLNPYSYLMGNPLSGKDPTGYQKVCSINGGCFDSQAEAPTGSNIKSNTVLSGKTEGGVSFSTTFNKNGEFVSGTFQNVGGSKESKDGAAGSNGKNAGQNIKAAVEPTATSPSASGSSSSKPAASVKWDPSLGVPQPDAPPADELDYVRNKAAPIFAAFGDTEHCASVCKDPNKSGADAFSLSAIKNSMSHIACDTTGLSCSAGSTQVSDIHNHPRSGMYRATYQDENLGKGYRRGDSIDLPNEHAFSLGDMQAGGNQWLVPNGSSLLLYRPKTEFYPVHSEFQRSP
jgi:hypothetical protein